MKKLPSLTIFFPVLNDSRAISALVAKADKVAQRVSRRYEILIIDDGSTDSTPEVLHALEATYSKLRVITNKKNKGYGAALRRGFAEASYDWVFYTDGDGQYDPLELVDLVETWNPELDVVNGFKLRRHDPLFRKIIGSIYNLVSHVEYTLPVSDVQCDFRLIRSRILKNIVLVSTSGLICLELVVKLHEAGARFAEIPVHHYARSHGNSQFFRLGNLIRTAREHVGLLFRKLHIDI